MRIASSPRVAFVSVLLLAACRGGAAPPAAPPPAPVVVAQVTRKSLPVEVRAVGSVEASAVVELRARVTGQVEAVNFREGDRVAKGQPLVSIDRRPFEVAVTAAEAALARDRALAENARQDVGRYATLVEKEYVTREQYDKSLADAAAAEATVRADEAAVERARLELGYTSIRAPVAGRVGATLVQAGNLIEANDAVLVVIRATRPVHVSFAVPERQLAEIRRRAAVGPLEVAVTTRGNTAETRRGTLFFVDNTVDETTGTIRLKALFPNEDDGLWPGEFVDVALRLAEEPDALTVPMQAVQTSQQGDFVFVVKDDQTVESRPVKIARRQGPDVVIASGVQPGETVVTEGQLRLVPGARVAVRAGS